MQIGDVNILESLVNSELRIGVLEKLLEKLMNDNFNLNKPTQIDIENFKLLTIKELQMKYPNLGLERS